MVKEILLIMQTNNNHIFNNNSYVICPILPDLTSKTPQDQGNRLMGTIEKVLAISQTDNNYNSIVNSYIGLPDPVTERLIRSGLAYVTAGSGPPIAISNGYINFFYLTPLLDSIMLSPPGALSMSLVLFAFHRRGKGGDGTRHHWWHAGFETRCRLWS
jgi:hypothetical protein